MKSNRRKFLQYSGLTGIGLAGANMMKGFGANTDDNPDATLDHLNKTHRQHFNMCGYAAPKLETVCIGFIGLGNRGPAAVKRMTHIEGVSIQALCDLRPEKVDAVKKHWKAPYTNRRFIPVKERNGKNYANGP